MLKYIQKLLRTLRMEVMAVLLILAAAVAMGELGVIPNGIVMPHSSGEFKLNTVAIVATIIFVPGAIRLFTLNTTKGLRRMDNEEALQSYHVWSAVRMGILCLTAVCDVVVYYLSTSISGALCALITLLAMFYCWPSEEKIASYLECVNKE